MSSSDPPPSAKLSFGFSKQQTQRRLDAGKGKKEESRQEITAIEGGVLKTASGQPVNAAAESKQYIVPKLENTFQTGVGNREKAKKFTPSFKPPDSSTQAIGDSNERFEAAKEDTRPTITEYGLEKRVRPDAAAMGGEGSHRQKGAQNGESENEEHGKAEYVPPAKLEEAALERDVQGLPDEIPVEAYEEMPIEEFGKAMLRGMGWSEGMGVGRNRKQAQPIEYLRRPERLGLGAAAVPAKDAGKKKVVKMGDKPEVSRGDLVLPPDADGRQRHIRTLDEKLVHRSEVAPGPRPGKVMQIVGGRHIGLACRVVEVLPQKENRSSYSAVTLLLSNETVDVRCSDLAESGQQHQQQPQAAESEGHEPHRRSHSRTEDGDWERRDIRRHTGKEASIQDRRSRDEDDRVERERGDGRGGRRRGEEARDVGEKHKDRASRGEDRSKEGRRREDDGGGDSKRRHVEMQSEEGRKDSRGGEKAGRCHESQEEREEEAGPASPKRSWLAPYIKVRVVDKKVRGGRLYLKKGTVVDVHPGGLCDVAMDEGHDVLQLGQAALETVVPKEVGAAVLVVEGSLRGSKARVQAKTAEVCAVQLESDLSVQRLLLDEVAMFVGPMDDD